MTARAVALRLHLLMGLILGGALLLLAGSGAVLVFRAELEAVLYPSSRPPGPGGGPVPLQAIVEAAERRHPGARFTSVQLPEPADEAARVVLTARAGERIEVLVSRSGPAVLGSRWLQRSPLHALRLLHTELYLGPRGSLLVGGLGLLLAVQGTTGLYLWWPFLRRPVRAFRIRRSRAWPIVSYDVHKAVGAASLAFCLPVAVTGALLALAALGPAPDAGRQEPTGSAPRAAPSPLSLDAVVGRAHAALPGGRLAGVETSTGSPHLVLVRLRRVGELDPRGGSLVLVDRRAGEIVGVRDAGRGTGRLRALVAPLHFGSFGGVASKLAYLVGGLALAVLVLTGHLAWLLRRRRDRPSASPSPPVPCPRGPRARRRVRDC
jgi:uncharacterized iron-regulated membrane protein